ncbi:MAG: hypothetical protein KC422_04920 [Trueperaceae bacterium]|nr:hypothetical protein [Trueperaceae bacterium]
MKNPEKFVELAQKLGLSPKALEQYMACKHAEAHDSKSFATQPQTSNTAFTYSR